MLLVSNSTRPPMKDDWKQCLFYLPFSPSQHYRGAQRRADLMNPTVSPPLEVVEATEWFLTCSAPVFLHWELSFPNLLSVHYWRRNVYVKVLMWLFCFIPNTILTALLERENGREPMVLFSKLLLNLLNYKPSQYTVKFENIRWHCLQNNPTSHWACLFNKHLLTLICT